MFGTSLLGIITRCPLVLKLKKQLGYEAPWRGKISYQNTELQLQDPSQVEREIYKGRVHFCRLGAGLLPSWPCLLCSSPSFLSSTSERTFPARLFPVPCPHAVLSFHLTPTLSLGLSVPAPPRGSVRPHSAEALLL